MEETISLQEILKIIKKRLWLITSVTIVGVSIAVALSFYFITPMYQAQSQILVNQKVNYQEGMWGLNEIDLQLISTYNGIITSSAILNKVIEELDLNISPEELMENITVSNENNSKVVNIIITDEEHQQAVKIANTIAEIFQEEIPLLMNVDNINILSEAELSENTSPVKPNKVLYLAIGTVAGGMLGFGLALLLEVLDTRIKNEKDVEEILSLPVIGLVGKIQPKKKKISAVRLPKARGTENVWIEK